MTRHYIPDPRPKNDPLGAIAAARLAGPLPTPDGFVLDVAALDSAVDELLRQRREEQRDSREPGHSDGRTVRR